MISIKKLDKPNTGETVKTYKLGKRSLEKLEGIHPDLVKVVKKAISITKQDFAVIQGLRDAKQQAENVKKGVSWTQRSRHLSGH